MRTANVVAVVLVLLVTACAKSDSDGPAASFQVHSTNVAVVNATPIEISGARIAFLADEEATGRSGTDLNGDGDDDDQVAHVVNTAAGAQRRLGVAAEALAWAGAHLFLAVDEGADEEDWNDDDDEDDAVLLHWSEASDEIRWVDDLAVAQAGVLVSLGERVLYVAAAAGGAAGESNLRFVEFDDPFVPVPVPTADVDGPLAAEILGQEEGLVFVALDETAQAPTRDLNGDGDDEDRCVLALLDGTDGASVLRGTELAIDPDSPRRAKARGQGDWRVGFLVNEHDQDEESLNSSVLLPNLRPNQWATTRTTATTSCAC